MKKAILAAFVAAAALVTTSCNQTGGPRPSLKTDVDTVSYEMGLVMSASPEELSNYLIQSGADSAATKEFIKGFTEAMTNGEDKAKLAYYMGLAQGMQLRQQLPMMEAQVFQGDSTKKVSVKNFLAGFAAYANGKSAFKRDGKPVDKEAANKHIMSYVYGKNRQESTAFMAKTAKQPGVKKLAGGVLYKEIKAGTGTRHALATDTIVVKYEGRLSSGQVFDSSEKAGGEGTLSMPLANMIEGWKIAIPHMTEGAEWEIYIPYDKAYGESGGPVPPFSALIFKVTLVSIK